MRVYVTGVAGFLGSNVANALIEQGHSVSGCDDMSVGRKENIPERVRFDRVDCRFMNEHFLYGEDAVVHCAAIARSAWPDPSQLWWSNVRGTLSVVKSAKAAGIENVVHASSSVVHVPDSSVYAQTKAAAERVALAYGATCLRFGNIYGPGQNELGHEPNVIASMRASAKKTGVVRVDGDGEQTRDFVHVDDASNAVVSALKERIGPLWVDICTNRQTSIKTIADAFGLPLEWAPSRNDPAEIVQDNAAAEALLLWLPTIDIEEGLPQVTQL